MIVLWRCRLISASNWFHNFCCISGSNFISFSLIKSWSCWTRPESSFAVYFPANLAPITSPVREGMIWKLESSVMMRKSLKFNDYGLIGCVGPFNQFSFIRKFHYKQRNKLCPRPNHNASSSSHQHFFSLATTTTVDTTRPGAAPISSPLSVNACCFQNAFSFLTCSNSSMSRLCSKESLSPPSFNWVWILWFCSFCLITSGSTRPFRSGEDASFDDKDESFKWHSCSWVSWIWKEREFLSTTEFKFSRSIVQAWVSSVICRVVCRVSNLKDWIFVHDGM